MSERLSASAAKKQERASLAPIPRRANAVLAFGLAATASGYASERIERHHQQEQVRQQLAPVLERAVNEPGVVTRLAIHEQQQWPLVAAEQDERLPEVYRRWREVLSLYTGGYQVIREHRSASFIEEGDSVSHDALRLRVVPDSAAFVTALMRLHRGREGRDIQVLALQEEVADMNEHRAIEEGLERIVNRVHEWQADAGHDGPVPHAFHESSALTFLPRLMNGQPNTVQFLAHPLTRLGRPVVVAEFSRTDMVVYLNRIRVERVGTSGKGGLGSFRISADVVRDAGTRFIHSQE